jgi:transcription antitermination factor nusB
MSRSNERRAAFEIIFSLPFNLDTSTEQLIENYYEAKDLVNTPEYVKSTVEGVRGHIDEIDSLISDNLKNWAPERVDLVCRAALRLCIYEMLYNDQIPTSVAINEAINIAKEYSGQKAGAFVNGVVSPIAKDKNN